MRHTLWFRHSGGRSGWTKCCLLIVPVIVVFFDAQAQSGAWTRKQDMPTGQTVIAYCAAVVNNKIYLLGGMDAGWQNYADNQVYDPATNTWEKKQPMQYARGLLSAAAVNDTVYAIGGGYLSTTLAVEAYDPASNTWTPKANMLAYRFGAAAGVVDGVIYNVGGNHYERNCEAYNPTTNTWTRKADIPETYGGVMVASYGGLLYGIGGGFDTAFATVYAYDPKTDQWTKKADMPTARSWSHPAPVVNGKIYILGGHRSVWGEVLSTVEVYDPASDTWTKKPDMPFKRTFFGAAVVNSKIYIMGGTTDWISGEKDIWEYDPTITGIASASALPDHFALQQNYPNPFNPSTSIKFELPRTSHVSLSVFDILGREVSVLVNERRNAGVHEVKFDGSKLASGVYFYRLQAGDYVATNKMHVMK